jgi:hypothetical protein
VARLFAAANPSMQVITGTGHLITYTSNGADILPPVIVERNSGVTDAIFGNVIDVSGTSTAYVKGVTQEGSLTSGYALLKVQTVTGGTDLCYTSYTPGTFTTQGGELTTDAQQAFVVMDGANVQGLYLGGGTTLTAGSLSIQRADSTTPGAPGLAYVELTGSGYVVGNMSPTSGATITVTLPGAGTQIVTLGPNSISAPLAANLLYEPFNLPTGSINGQPAGPNSLGLTGTWSQGNNPIVTPGLTYSGLSTIGNALSASSGINSVISINMNAMPAGDTYVNSGTTYLGAPGTTLWFSTLMRPTVSGTNTSYAQLVLGGMSYGGGAKVNLGETGTDGCLSVTADGTTASTHVPAVTGTTYLLVMSVYWSGTPGHDQINMYVNPPLGSTPPGTPSASLSNITIGQVETDGGVNYLDCKATRTTTFDELIMASSWDTLW